MNFDPFWPLSGKSLTVIGISHCSRCLGAWLSTRHWRAPEDITMWALFSTAKCTAFWSILQGYKVGNSRVTLFVCIVTYMYETTLNNMYIWSFYEYTCACTCTCIIVQSTKLQFFIEQLKNALIYMFMYTEFTYKEE